jgi:hypothetical protein
MMDVVPNYEIRVRGRLSDTVLSSFEELDARLAAGETVLFGPVGDQAALHGLLDRVRALGLELLEVRRLR